MIQLPLCLAFALLAPRAQDSVEDLIARGRAELALGRAPQAQVLFEKAAEKDGGSLRSRTFVLRSWMEQGRINDALNEIDGLDKKGSKGPAMDYLYGMAFARKWREYVQQNVPGAAVQMAQEDALEYLRRATTADPELARDAFLPLSEVAWYAQKLDLARAAAERAIAVEPENADARFMLGRIALSQFVASKDDESRKAEADAHWEAARSSLRKAVEFLGKPTEAARIDTLARVHVDLGHTLVWKQKIDEAGAEYAEAIAGKPALVDFAQILRTLGNEKFLAALEAADRASTLAGADRATLRWWLGWARFDQKQYEQADLAFAAAVKDAPAFVNSWFYMALARYHQRNYEGAVAALRRNFDENPEDLVASIGANKEFNLSILDYLVGWCSTQKRNVEAATLSEIQAAAAPQVSRYFNNAGLFWRDAGDALKESGSPDEAPKALELYEKSFQAYTRAVEIEPGNPNYLNDLAVVLHYNLQRDLERAKDLYKKAAERAEAELARTDLAPDVRELYKTALRDSHNNLKKLEKGEKRDS